VIPIPIAIDELPRAALGAGAAPPTGIEAAPGVVVGVLLIIAAIAWFSPYQRYKFRKATLWLVIVAVAMIIIFGYLDVRPGGEGAS
jgi:hypothetical protein